MDYPKLYGDDESCVSSLVYTLYTFSDGIRMEFGVKQFGELDLKTNIIKYIDGTMISSVAVMEQIERVGHKYLWIL